MPKITVLMPLFNGIDFIRESLESVQKQTFTDWEFIIVNDFGSDDGCADVVREYAAKDLRIILVQAEKRLGLAASLNMGLNMARGRYIARLDADDTSAPERFAKQVAFLDRHPEVGICGTWQHHHGKNTDWVHKAHPDPKMQRCRLLFWCDLCHSTLMLRRDAFIDNGLFYNPEAQAEDFELWTRAMEYMQIANIPEVLGEYSEDTGITANKLRQLDDESGQITARTVKRILGVDIPAQDRYLLNGWLNPLPDAGDRDDGLERLKKIFCQIWEGNQRVGFFDESCLLQVLTAKWQWVKNEVDWRKAHCENVKRIEDVFSDRYKPSLMVRYQEFKENNPSASVRARKIFKRFVLRPPAQLLRRQAESPLGHVASCPDQQHADHRGCAYDLRSPHDERVL